MAQFCSHYRLRQEHHALQWKVCAELFTSVAVEAGSAPSDTLGHSERRWSGVREVRCTGRNKAWVSKKVCDHLERDLDFMQKMKTIGSKKIHVPWLGHIR